MMVRRGESAVLNQMRDDILESHTRVKIVDVPNFYDTSIFNECEQMNYLMETLDIWTDIHPSLVTLPMKWEYKVSYGIVYAKSLIRQQQNLLTSSKTVCPTKVLKKNCKCYKEIKKLRVFIIHF